MNKVDRELQAYYENQFDLFAHPGWRDLLEDYNQFFDAVNDLNTVENTETLYYRRGQMDVLRHILERKTSFENAWTDLNG